ncbi:unnamed protein product [Amoebophrya sp. A120]|nr:unnamed protein product [Amoebophrya sp. A120]|eukprot:GSA120T00003617001.1
MTGREAKYVDRSPEVLGRLLPRSKVLCLTRNLGYFLFAATSVFAAAAAVEDDVDASSVTTVPKSTNIVYDASSAVTREHRWGAQGRSGLTVWMTGLSGSGKSTISRTVEKMLFEKDVLAYRLDGDNLRFGLNSDLGFSEADRTENVRRVSEVAQILADAGAVVLCALIAPNKEDRARVRKSHERTGIPFLEVFVNAPLQEAERRDPKGLYKKARAGIIPGFTGVSAPYDVPEAPDTELRTDLETVEESAAKLLDAILEKVKLEPKKDEL